MALYKVKATSLWLRSTPDSSGNINKIAALPNGQIVEKIRDAGNGWWEVSTLIANLALATGYVAHTHLEALPVTPPPPPPPPPGPPIVHLTENRTDIRRNQTWGRAYPLGENTRPARDNTAPINAANSLHNIINWLNVEQSARYAPTSSATFCNIYAYDYCYLAGVYLPRVWWTDRALLDIAAGRTVSVNYGQTVMEMNANSLLRWLRNWGPQYGWRLVFGQSGLNQLQAEANLGKIGIISARNRNENHSGHICAVAPENTQWRADRYANGDIRYPLQTQAGRVNKKYFNNSAWWRGDSMAEFGYFVHD